MEAGIVVARKPPWCHGSEMRGFSWSRHLREAIRSKSSRQYACA